MIHRLSGRICVPALAGVLALGACGGPSSDRTVKDEAGRTCSIPEVSLTYSCDATPQPSLTCTAAETPCFSRGTIGDVGPAAVCAACCMDSQATTTPADCSQIVCATVDDCPPGSTQCQGGGCCDGDGGGSTSLDHSPSSSLAMMSGASGRRAPTRDRARARLIRAALGW